MANPPRASSLEHPNFIYPKNENMHPAYVKEKSDLYKLFEENTKWFNQHLEHKRLLQSQRDKDKLRERQFINVYNSEPKLTNPTK